MIYSYAIEPAAVAGWAKKGFACRYITDSFGLGRTRVMAEFPKVKNWKKQVWQAGVLLGDMEKKKLEILIKHLSEVSAQHKSESYDGNFPWLENALRENLQRPFRAIIAKENPGKDDHVLLLDQDDELPAEKWSAENNATTQRIAKNMADAVAPMLRNSRKIVFVDPYFRASREQFLIPLQLFLQNCGLDSGKTHIEIHASSSYENAPSPDLFKKEFQDKLSPKLPRNTTVIIKRWQQRGGGEKLHNRYILTDIGGVSFGTGLDCGKSGETDDISLLARDQFVQRWYQYTGENPAFDLELCFKIPKN